MRNGGTWGGPADWICPLPGPWHLKWTWHRNFNGCGCMSSMALAPYAWSSNRSCICMLAQLGILTLPGVVKLPGIGHANMHRARSSPFTIRDMYESISKGEIFSVLPSAQGGRIQLQNEHNAWASAYVHSPLGCMRNAIWTRAAAFRSWGGAPRGRRPCGMQTTAVGAGGAASVLERRQSTKSKNCELEITWLHMHARFYRHGYGMP